MKGSLVSTSENRACLLEAIVMSACLLVLDLVDMHRKFTERERTAYVCTFARESVDSGQLLVPFSWKTSLIDLLNAFLDENVVQLVQLWQQNFLNLLKAPESYLFSLQRVNDLLNLWDLESICLVVCAGIEPCVG